ncbi:hypothetical protein V6432_004181 [Vibrio parahaemolyticus]
MLCFYTVKRDLMKRLILATTFSFLMLGCTSQPEEPTMNYVDIGPKESANSVIELTYHNSDAAPEYQNFTVSLYVSQLPSEASFEMCNFADDVCNSGYSVWQNPLRPEQKGVWFSYDLAFPIAVRKELEIELPITKHLTNQTLLEWDKPTTLHTKNVYSDGNTNVHVSMTAVVRQLL